MTKVFFLQMGYPINTTDQQNLASHVSETLGKVLAEDVEVVIFSEGMHFIDKDQLLEMLSKK